MQWGGAAADSGLSFYRPRPERSATYRKILNFFVFFSSKVFVCNVDFARMDIGSSSYQWPVRVTSLAPGATGHGFSRGGPGVEKRTMRGVDWTKRQGQKDSEGSLIRHLKARPSDKTDGLTDSQGGPGPLEIGPPGSPVRTPPQLLRTSDTPTPFHHGWCKCKLALVVQRSKKILEQAQVTS